ncbi:UDP-galactose transporter senju isoform X2 [Diabrotica virgifera virgifera]|uniref:UDP-galactose transporter senju n=1 Tax=Diabrotica virgifera virgifera TaxID=50390 RepID=A0ABM5KWL9_DIAVI|nr:UDP-galactose transporter senju isoform X2 [Diabrotica virgifera virgifera]
MSSLNWKELFPTKLSLIIFIGYILLFVNQGILVTASQRSDNNYNYNIVTVVLLTEVLKLVISSVLYCKDNSTGQLISEVVKHKHVLLLYFVPAFLYCLYNNLAFLNLSSFDPTTYFLLLQLRVVVTGVLFQAIFKKILSKRQWISLVILTFGCMLKQINLTQTTSNTSSSNNTKAASVSLGIDAIFIFIQIICSCLAGVYNEYLLKDKGASINIFVQNVFMYLDSIVCNVLLLILNGNILEAFVYENILKVLHYKVLLVMFNNAAIGIVTSFFLKNLNSILKTFASALELVFTALLSYLLFSIPIYLNTVLSIATVMGATYLYSQNPVHNPPKPVQDDSIEKERLLEEV